MKILHSKSLSLPRGWLGAVLVAFLPVVVIAGAWAQAPTAGENQTPIEISADRLVADNAARSADFRGNVTAVQGETEITADRLVLFFSESGNTGESPNMVNGAIERMEAYGQVRIVFDNKVAVSDQAVYIVNERKLVLEGPGSRVTSGKDQVEGSKITFYRNDGRIALEGSADQRVRVTIHSEQRGLN
jgi:lipopolysaccharide export system protein LptA